MPSDAPQPSCWGVLLAWPGCLSHYPTPETWTLSPFLFSISEVPKGAETFGVSASSEVEVSMAYDPARVTEPTGKARWPLGANVDVIISVDTASRDLNDIKVRRPSP